MALLLSVWNCCSLYEGNIEDMFYNAMVAYYLACGNVALLEKKFGARWEQYFLPVRSFVNAMMLVGQFVGRCLTYPTGIPFMPDKTRERFVEIFFARIKSHMSGSTPRLKDMIHGMICPFSGSPSSAKSCLSHFIPFLSVQSQFNNIQCNPFQIRPFQVHSGISKLSHQWTEMILQVLPNTLETYQGPSIGVA